MRNPYFRWIFAVVFMLTAFLPQKVDASHALGAEITYECLGGDQYRIRLVFYRDCGGINAPTAPSISISSSCGNQTLGMNLLPPEDPFPPFDQYLVDYELPVYCAPSNCGSGSNPGIQQYIYEATVNLPPCADWTFSYDLCCRSAAINTISAPGNQDIYVSAFLNNQAAPCNNSPQFDVPARGFLCLNEDNTILATAYDVDGDMLVYSLYTPLDDPGNPVNYTGGYGPNNPLNNSGYTFNNGVIDVHPTSNGQITVVGVMVEEYRNGVLIGRVVRDMQVRVINNCPQNPGNNFDIDQDGVFDSDTIVLCANNPVQLDVYLDNTLPNLNYTIVAENVDDFPGATFTNVPDGSAPGGIVGQFVWTPDQSDIGTSQVLVFTAFDDNCPVVGFANFTYEFIITGLELDVDIDTVAISCTDSVQMNTIVSNGTPPYTYEWNTGSTDPSIWVTAGQYVVTVTDSEGCTGNDTIDVFYIDDPVALFDPSNSCVDSAVTFVDQSYSNYPVGFPPLTIVDWNWDFGDGSPPVTGVPNPTHSFDSTGSYAVQLIATNNLGCVDTLEHVVWANPAPNVDFTFENVCRDTLFTFTDQSTIDTGQIVNWAWDFGDNSGIVQSQNTTHEFLISDYYNVTLVAVSDSGCSAFLTQEVYAFPIPVADFSLTDVCIGNVSAFTDLTTLSAGNVESWQWDFGDMPPGTSALQNPVYTFQDTGAFDVTLIVGSDSLCFDTITQQVMVHPAPATGFFNDTVCAELVMNFTDTSSVESGSIIAWDWNFGNGVSSDQNPTNIYDQGGQYTVTLAVETDLGCIDTVAKNIIVYPKPNAEFLTYPACLNDTNQFIDQSGVSAGSQIVGWDWDFGDNNGTSTDQSPWYIFGNSDVFDVQLITETDNGCLDTVVHLTEVFVLPEADFTFNNVCAYDAAVFQNTSSIAEGSITDNLWDFGNNNTVNSVQPVGQMYDSSAVYDVQLITISNHGCLDTSEQTIEIYAVPTAMFTYDSVCYPFATTFTDLSTVGGSYTVTDWVWKFGDLTPPATNQNPIHAYAEWGDYWVDLSIETDVGCTADTTLGPVRVYPKPQALFSDEIANCLNDTTVFEDLSTLDNYPEDQIVTWGWDFADGYSSTSQDTAHVFGDDGFYDVELSVVTNNGCQDSIVLPVEIYPLPSVALAVDTNRGCQPFHAQFFDMTSIPSPYLLDSWSWNFGDGSDTVSTQNPEHTYWDDKLGDLDIGVYSVSLEVTSANGCVSDTTYVDYMIEYPKPDALFAVDPERTEILFPKFSITDLATPNVVNWHYDWGDGSTSTLANPIHEYADTGYYDITQIVTTEFGCMDTVEVTVRVDPEFRFYIPSAFTPDADGKNETFYGSGIGIVDYQMRIYDRWGELLFESNEADHHWDGTYKSKQVQQGVYIYYFELMDVKGEPHKYRGHVTLFR